ncbi:MAG: hypothetical protein GY805_33020 [Chloroflexi bacterium]|nr:hypothetical protein [Chloroflexota bacterium]
MKRAKIEMLQGGRVRQVSLLAGERPFTHAEVIQKWQTDELFRTFFIGLLADAPFDAYFWETPPVTQDDLQRPFQFVLVEAPQLAQVQATSHAFVNYFNTDPVVDFANLGGDAHLVVPCPQTAVTAYPHLAAFSRLAPIEQQHHFWQRVGTAVTNHVGKRPLWVSTSGLGVYWLHVRLDSRPKYYTYRPYRKWK